jgi:hypothetical protein
MGWELLAWPVKWLFSSGLGRILDSVDRAGLSETEREKARYEAITNYAQSQATLADSRMFWLMVMFAVPFGLWVWAVCLYSILWCKGCAMPQDWSVAALPSPLDEWAGAIIAALFGGGFLIQGVKIWKK